MGADGVNSRVRAAHADVFKPDIDVRACKYIWLGTRQKFDDAFTFIFEETEHGWIWAHAYQFDADSATFIVECSEQTWRNFGFDAMSGEETIAACEKVFARNLGGNALMSNAKHLRGSAWLNFNRVLCERWSYRNIVLLGDAAATAHFSVGSGSKLAMESAIALANYIDSEPDLESAFRRYEDERRLEVLRLQNAARNSTEWFEDVERYFHLDPVQFNYSLLTRSQRISHENLRQRDPAWLAGAEKWFERQATGRAPNAARPPMFVPFRVRGLELIEPRLRLADGAIPRGRRHAQRLALRALRRARQGRRRPGVHRDDLRVARGTHFSGLHRPLQPRARARLEEARGFRARRDRSQDRHSARPFGPQRFDPARLGRRRTRRLPTAIGRPSALLASPGAPNNPAPREMTRADMDEVRDAFVRAAEMADRAGFDWLELHYAHGYLMSSFITPLTNRRSDEYGGSLDNRMRFPLEVFHAVREVWPDEKPISVRISAHDWVGPDGIQPQDAVAISRMLAEHGVDLVDVSAGQTSVEAKPVYGRMFQTPFSDRIRNEVGIATLAVGNIYEPDHVNSILMAGRADLVCLARPHLADPYWTLHAAADLRYEGVPWPKPYRAGRDQLYRLRARAEANPATMTGKV